MDLKPHWEAVYNTKKPTEVSWYQDYPAVSVDMIVSAKLNPEQKIIDAGAGASVLVDILLKKGFKDITVLDISSKFEPMERYDLQKKVCSRYGKSCQSRRTCGYWSVFPGRPS